MNLRFEKCPNFRSLSGYRLKNGNLTSGSVYRADSIVKLSANDINLLYENGLACVIDLRYESELAAYPNPVRDDTRFNYHNVSLSDGLYSATFDNLLDKDMWEVYIGIADEAIGELRRVFKIMAGSESGIVFHCTAGKDRTGVVAALLLENAGVVREDIVNDYALSYELQKDILEADKASLRAQGIMLKDHVFLAEPHYIERFLDHIERRYGGALGYLTEAGLTHKETAALKNLLSKA